MLRFVDYAPKYCACCGEEIAGWNKSGYCSRTEECRRARLRVVDPRRKTSRALYAGDSCAVCGAPIAGYNTTGHCSRTAECRRRGEGARRLALKLAAFEAYGGLCCACCGETRLYFLTLDHVVPIRRNKVTQGTESGSDLWWKLKKAGYPDRGQYQVLCFNCNCAKGTGTECPCKAERSLAQLQR
jgi:hypothetical protein